MISLLLLVNGANHLPVKCIIRRQTSVDGEVLHRDGRGHAPDVVQHLFSQAGGGAAHGLWLSIQSEKT